MDEEQQLVSALNLARFQLILKNYDESLHWLERLPERPNFFVPYVAVDPIFDPLRSNPRFQTLLHRLRLS